MHTIQLWRKSHTGNKHLIHFGQRVEFRMMMTGLMFANISLGICSFTMKTSVFFVAFRLATCRS